MGETRSDRPDSCPEFDFEPLLVAIMPPDLPGFYWDGRRYFPLSSKPKAAPIPALEAQPLPTPVAWPKLDFRTTLFYKDRIRIKHDLTASNLALTSRRQCSSSDTVGQITAFSAATIDDRPRRFLGDNRGWLYASAIDEQFDENTWVHEVNLHPESEVSSICMSERHCVATGSSAHIAIQDFSVPGTLVMGAKKEAVCMEDIEMTSSARFLNTQSTVFSLEQQQHLVYAGARNGTITLFDLRVDKPMKILQDKAPSPVMSLKLLRDSGLLVSTMDGNGLCVDPDEEFVFAAGKDCQIQAWSLLTTEAIIAPSGTTGSPFCTRFPDIVATLQVTQEKDGLCLWAGTGQTIYRYYLGQRQTN
ncbi:hypothetical protein C8J56DRAFT_911521 [Mycena floridula]|nr:hypothetical protein C8J56DRAFT_911521 [Mycena floridula]